MPEKTFDFPIAGELKPEHMPAVYKALAADLPVEAIQHAAKEDTKKGHDMTGYAVQYAIDRMNDILGPDHWHFTYWTVGDVQVIGKTSTGRDMYQLLLELEVQLGNWKDGVPGRDGDGLPVEANPRFVGLASHRNFGGHISLDRVDLYKGAVTNALKKVLAMFGVGARAYRGELDEDYRAQEAMAKQTGAAPPTKRPKPSSSSPQGSPRPSEKAREPFDASKVRPEDTGALRKAFVASCDARKLNRFSVLVKTYGTVTTGDLSPEQLSQLIDRVQKGQFDSHKSIGTEKPNLQQAVTELAVAYCREISGQQEPAEARKSVETLLKQMAQAQSKEDFEKLTIQDLRDVGLELSRRMESQRKRRAQVNALKQLWWERFRADTPQMSEEEAKTEAKRSLEHFAATLGFTEGVERLGPDEIGHILKYLEDRKVDVLAGELIPADDDEGEPLF